MKTHTYTQAHIPAYTHIHTPTHTCTPASLGGTEGPCSAGTSPRPFLPNWKLQAPSCSPLFLAPVPRHTFQTLEKWSDFI